MNDKKWHKDELSKQVAEQIGINTYGMDTSEVSDALPQDINDAIDDFINKYDQFDKHGSDNAYKDGTDEYPHEERERLRKIKDEAYKKLQSTCATYMGI